MNDVSAQATCAAMLLLKRYDFDHSSGNINSKPPHMKNTGNCRSMQSHLCWEREDVARWNVETLIKAGVNLIH